MKNLSSISLAPAGWQLGSGVLLLLLLWVYSPVLPDWARQCWNEPDYSHGFLIFPVSGLLIWLKRQEAISRFRSATQDRDVPRSGYGGPMLMALAMTCYVLGTVGADLFLQRISFVIMVAGAVLLLAGRSVFQVVAFPIGYLALAIPLPGIIFQSMALPLQLLAARISAAALQGLAVPVYREGSILHLSGISLDIEEACSGIRSLMTLLALGVLFAYLREENNFRRLILVAAVVPITIVANVFRVTATGFLVHYVSPAAGLDFFHWVGGLLVFAVAVALFVLLAEGLKRVL